MRIVLILLVLANLSLFGYTWFDRAGRGEGVRLTQQVQPDKIKLLSPREVAALGPGKVAALADVCAEWGPFSDADRSRAAAELAPFGLTGLLTQRRVDVAGTFGVALPAFANKSAAERRASELRGKNLADVSVIDSGGGQYAVLLGVFRTEDAAAARVAALASAGFPGARVVPRQQTLPQTLFVVRDPQAPLVARLKELQPAYPEAELKIGSCERA
jgi:hypothetical protein